MDHAELSQHIKIMTSQKELVAMNNYSFGLNHAN